tara:strand:+ start:412 stop:591 length:180 start_codon:yes stop_codon:yes gene_type:complete
MVNNETIKLVEDCKDLMIDIKNNLHNISPYKKILDSQIAEMENFLLNESKNKKDHWFIG